MRRRLRCRRGGGRKSKCQLYHYYLHPHPHPHPHAHPHRQQLHPRPCRSGRKTWRKSSHTIYPKYNTLLTLHHAGKASRFDKFLKNRKLLPDVASCSHFTGRAFVLVPRTYFLTVSVPLPGRNVWRRRPMTNICRCSNAVRCVCERSDDDAAFFLQSKNNFAQRQSRLLLRPVSKPPSHSSHTPPNLK